MKKRICAGLLAMLLAWTLAAPGAASDRDGAPGPLHLEGTQLTDANGEPVQLRGVSTHGLAWYPQYVNADCFRQLHDQWGADLVRLAMYTAEYGGYCSGGDQEALKALVLDGVAYAADAGMYAIVDWHILSDGDPNIHKDEALAFFSEMSAALAERDNVIYEICNEPNGGTDWTAVKAYALEVIGAIRQNDPDAVIIVGTPEWCQRVDLAAADPITEYDNVMYALHFYADTHRDQLRDRLEAAVAAGLPVFVSEFGICDASGSGAVNEDEAAKWVRLMDRLGVSYAAWNLSNKDETSAMLDSGCQKTSGFDEADLSQSGRWVVGLLSGQAPPEVSAPAESGAAAADAPVEQDGLLVEAKLANSWQSGGEGYYQYTLTLTNASGADREGWTVELAFDGPVTLQDGWNGVYSVQGSTLTVQAKDYNADLPAGGTVADVGFIVSGAALAGD